MSGYLSLEGYLPMLGDASTPVPIYWGYIASVIAVILFGSNFVPVKKFETGDGMFFQWIVCWAIWITGLVIHLIVMQHVTQPFYPLAMLGGFLWATGNIAVVPIIKTIGLGQGILIWGSFNLLIGWASGRFGWFGLDPEPPGNPTLNYIGMGLCAVSAIIYIFIKTETQSRVDSGTDDQDPLLQSQPDGLLAPDPIIMPQPTVNDAHVNLSDSNTSFIDRLSPKKKKIVGTILAIVSGLLYGVNFAPVIYIQNNYPGASQNGLDYVFAHFCGIFLTSTAYFLIYCAYSRNLPRVYPRAILPGFASGVLWAIADAGWFVANATLSEAVSFPIVTTGPGVVGAMWGLVFGEIRGVRNYVILAIACCITLAGGVLTGLSKQNGPYPRQQYPVQQGGGYGGPPQMRPIHSTGPVSSGNDGFAEGMIAGAAMGGMMHGGYGPGYYGGGGMGMGADLPGPYHLGPQMPEHNVSVMGVDVM